MSIDDLEKELRDAEERLRAIAAARGHGTGEWQAADRALLEAERSLAAARREEHAVPIEFDLEWGTGACPFVLAGGLNTFLLFEARTVGGDPPVIGLVTFRRCLSTKLGSPNDEVWHGHPLYGKGADGYSAQEVLNSSWIAQLEATNKVHHGYSADMWRRLRHFVFWFKNETFECVAETFGIEVIEGSMAGALRVACERASADA